MKASQFVIDQEGRRTAVILPLEEYEQLLEDLHDLAVVAERRDEEAIDFEDVVRRLRDDNFAGKRTDPCESRGR
jgi:PHD/YefM family antitoxin component YafN of YafNO toxin-antitoxin module